MYIDLPSATLYYEEQGSGETIILIHAHSVDCRMWDQQFNYFAQTNHVIRYDLRGYGKSTMPKLDERYRHVEDLIAMMDKLKISRAHLIGLSLGSMVALDAYAKYPERVRSAICAASGLYVENEEQWYEEENKQLEKENKTEPLDEGLFKKEWIDLQIRHSGNNKKEIEEELRRMIGDWVIWQPKYERIKPLIGPPIIKLLEHRKQELPLLVVIGDSDSNGSKESSGRLLRLVKEAESIDFPKAGHFSNMEQPENFNRAVLAFIGRSGQ
jgi:pimeloyl-ACP methyl ester carboxylesterase